MTLSKSCLLAAAIGLSAGSLVLASPAQAITTWNWSITTTNPTQFGSGTFTTADVTPTPGTTYNITGISGTYTHNNTLYVIDRLDYGYGSADNTFRWDGTNSSPILATANGISFRTTAFYYFNFFYAGLSYGPINESINDYGPGSLIAASTLSPVAPPVPGPLPIFGLATTFCMSRRLRRRAIKLN